MIDSIRLAEALTERFGLPVLVDIKKVPQGQKITIRPEDIEYTISFQVEVVLGWRTITAIFTPGNFATDLVRSMNTATTDQRSAFAVFASSLQGKGAKVTLEFDGEQAEPTVPDQWPTKWSNITISMKKIGVVLENCGAYDFDAAFPWTTGFFGMALSLLPLEPVPEKRREAEEEGAELYRLSKQYERSRINRAACIEIHGTSCKICNFSFKETYGEIGDGFIHIHHTVPLSLMGGSYVMNPATDLIPVCPNCHAMLHRKMPPYTVEEIEMLMRSKDDADG